MSEYLPQIRTLLAWLPLVAAGCLPLFLGLLLGRLMWRSDQRNLNETEAEFHSLESRLAKAVTRQRAAEGDLASLNETT